MGKSCVRYAWIAVVAVLTPLPLSGSTRAASEGIVPVGTQKQLFLDDSIVEQMSGLRRVPHRAEKYAGNPVVRNDRPWDRGMMYPVVVIRDAPAGLFHMWYRGVSAPAPKPGVESLCYARSRDGIKWEKPDLGLVKFEDVAGTNILGGNTMVAGFLDLEAPPERRFVALRGGSSPASVAVFVSPDGLHWQPLGESSGDLRKTPSSPPNPSARYFFTGQCWAGNTAWRAPRRGVMCVDSDNLTDWSGRRTIFRGGPEEPNLEFYTMSPVDIRRDHAQGDFFLGLLHCFRTDPNGKRNPGNQTAMSGPIDIELAFSRDTVTWQRLEGEPFLPTGPAGSFDAGMILLNSMVEYGDRLLFYYGGADFDHGEFVGQPSKEGHAQIGLATLRRDGFVSLEPEGDRGVLTTRPFLCAGDELLVNAHARRGKLVVEALDENGRPQPGFSAADCQPIAQDGLRVRVQWRQRALSALRGHVIRLRFVLHGDAALYAFQVAPAGR